MPKAILEFQLPEDQDEWDQAVIAGKLFSAIKEFDNSLRTKLKHGDFVDDRRDELEETRKELHKLLEEHNVAHLFT